jgi:hypothetical protein
MKGHANLGGMEVVGTGESRSHKGEGVGWGHSSNDIPGNREGAKGPWSTKGSTEKIHKIIFQRYEPEWQVSQPVLYGRPPRKREGAVRPSGVSSVVGEVP